jgi:hypothetical protein
VEVKSVLRIGSAHNNVRTSNVKIAQISNVSNFSEHKLLGDTPPPPPRSPTILGENINVKFACSGKLYCAPLKQDDAHTPMANQNSVRYSDSTSYFKKYSSSKCKQTVCLHYGLDFHFKAFEKTIEVFHDVLQRNVTTATDPHPQTNI